MKTTYYATFVLCVGVTSTFVVESDFLWPQYKQDNSLHFNRAEDEARREVFLTNLRRIEKHNTDAVNGLHSYWMGINQFAHMTNAEFMLYLQTRTPVITSSRNVTQKFQSEKDLPDSVDWRESGFVPPIREQGQCGDANLFATVDTLIGQERGIFRSVFELSTLQLEECCQDVPCSCTGSNDYLQCLVKLGGIESESDYPGTQCQTCGYDPKKASLEVLGETQVLSGNEDALKSAVANVGPIMAAIDATQFSFQLYSGGIYDDPNCSSSTLDHAVVVVGYGTEDDKDFWLVRNSWGPNWGEDGYIRMSRNKGNQCGIASQASFPLVHKK